MDAQKRVLLENTLSVGTEGPVLLTGTLMVILNQNVGMDRFQEFYRKELCLVCVLPPSPLPSPSPPAN